VGSLDLPPIPGDRQAERRRIQAPARQGHLVNRTSADLVDIVRDFLTAHQIMRRCFASFRNGDLEFVDLAELVGDDEGSVLFRLKERCHALFRPRDPEVGMATQCEALLDLAVGSLFHEAMKFRENFYQRESYGPRVRGLRSQRKEGDDALFREFEKILAAVSARLEEGVQENEILIQQTGDQLRVLLAEHPESDFVLRYLIENQGIAEDVFATSLDDLLAEFTGSPAEGFRCAGRSYLDSGFYEEADGALARSLELGGDPSELEPLRLYARGMMDYLAGSYGGCIAQLLQWHEAPGDKDASLLAIGWAAVSKIGQLVEGEDRERVSADAAALTERLAADLPAPSRSSSPARSPA
jgi:hypothetical protein